MNNKLERLETHLRNIFENNLLRLIPGNQPPRKLFEYLLQAMQNSLENGPEDQITAPDEFVINVPAEDLADWQSHQDILDEMANFIFKSSEADGIIFNQAPKILIYPDKNAPIHGFFVSAKISPKNPKLPDTATLPNYDKKNNREEIPRHAYMIVGGRENYPLEEPVIDIGRHSKNDLILDEAHVSRHHAQLRAINKRYIIFDVGSTAGIYVNGKRVSQATLQSGDVIKIGLINLIFVQDITSQNPTTSMPIQNNDVLESSNK